MRVLLIGSGGREHALAWKLNQSPKLETLYCAPGNAGISNIAECVDINELDSERLIAFCQEERIDFVVIGPEAPLVRGLADQLREIDIPVFGPSKKASQIEGSKAFMKDLLDKAGVPTAKYGNFTNIKDATKFIEDNKAPIVVKTSGLAAGKGVIICKTKDEAIKTAEQMLSGDSFGPAGEEIVIEEFLEGEELSYFALCDGKTFVPFASAQDHKRIGEGESGLNTGGMGAYSPAHMMTKELEQEIIDTCIKPTLETMDEQGYPFTGVLFCGIMLTNDGPRVLEYNIRFGDPECQALMLRLDANLLDLLYAAANGTLENVKDTVSWLPNPSLCVVIASKGYPQEFKKGTEIKGLDKFSNSVVFHAGTEKRPDGALINKGGRVLNICTAAPTLTLAHQKAYKDIEKMDWPDGYYRRDIGWQALEKETTNRQAS